MDLPTSSAVVVECSPRSLSAVFGGPLAFSSAGFLLQSTGLAASELAEVANGTRTPDTHRLRRDPSPGHSSCTRTSGMHVVEQLRECQDHDRLATGCDRGPAVLVPADARLQR